MMTGGCLCGLVRYETNAEPVFAGHCYCRDCQRASGTGHVPFMVLPREAVKIDGETRTYRALGDSQLPTTRHFCPICGSLVFGEPEAAEGMVSVYAGTLDDPSVFKPQATIYTRSRPAWDNVKGELTEYETMPPPRDPQLSSPVGGGE